MNRKFHYAIALSLSILFLVSCKSNKEPAAHTAGTIFQDVTLIDGNGGDPVAHTDILVQGDTISSIGKQLDTTGFTVINLSGKTIMPALISSHVHVGTLKGTSTKKENYTRDNILSQLKKYQDYGVTNIMVMGTDRPVIFESGLRDSSLNGLLPGARFHSAGYGFGVPQGAPPADFGMDHVYRPLKASQIALMMDSLVKVKPDFVKMWVDDFGGKFKKMDPAIYKTIIAEAHKHQLRVVSHAYYLTDARRLVSDGLDVIGHSIRDSVMDDQLVKAMKAKNVAYIPTLSLDEFAYIYSRKPEWVENDFFKRSLEPGVYEMVTAKKYQDSLKNSPSYPKTVAALSTALINLKKLYDAGVLVAMGTDSGATPVRAQGFSEHLELELMVEAGLTPLQAIGVATKNSARLLKIDRHYGTIEKGKIADLIILNENPAKDIMATRSISAVYKAGKQVSKGPLAK